MIHRILLALLLCVPATLLAQNEDYMQRMMEQARQAQQCMQQIDRDALQALARKSEQVEAKIKALCEAGKRDEAQQLGLHFAREMADSEVAKAVRRCSDMMAGALAGISPQGMPGMNMPSVEQMSQQHICDTY